MQTNPFKRRLPISKILWFFARAVIITAAPATLGILGIIPLGATDLTLKFLTAVGVLVAWSGILLIIRRERRLGLIELGGGLGFAAVTLTMASVLGTQWVVFARAGNEELTIKAPDGQVLIVPPHEARVLEHYGFPRAGELAVFGKNGEKKFSCPLTKGIAIVNDSHGAVQVSRLRYTVKGMTAELVRTDIIRNQGVGCSVPVDIRPADTTVYSLDDNRPNSFQASPLQSRIEAYSIELSWAAKPDAK